MTPRHIRHAAVLSAIGLACLLATTARAEGTCGRFWTTGYSSAAFPGLTADGTRTVGNEWTLVAAHPAWPFDTRIALDGVGEVRVADRGRLSEMHLDVLVYSAAEAFRLTGWRDGCW